MTSHNSPPYRSRCWKLFIYKMLRRVAQLRLRLHNIQHHAILGSVCRTCADLFSCYGEWVHEVRVPQCHERAGERQRTGLEEIECSPQLEVSVLP
jgi:hypothetical protein